jgi:phage-related protein
VLYEKLFQAKLLLREPDDWKPITTVGSGGQEIRIRDSEGAFRVIYIAKFATAVYVLRCCQKKTQKTGQHDLTAKRMKELIKELNNDGILSSLQQRLGCAGGHTSRSRAHAYSHQPDDGYPGLY